MSTGHIICGILLFAAATAILYVWGLRKSMFQGEELTKILLNRCGNKVVKYLRKHGTITDAEIAQEIKGVKAGEFWSKKRMMVQQPEKFVSEVISFLMEQQYIEAVGKKEYRLKK